MQPDEDFQRKVADFINASDQLGKISMSRLHTNFAQPDQYVQLIAALQPRTSLQVAVLAAFTTVLGNAYKEMTYEQGNAILSQITPHLKHVPHELFNETFETLAKVAVMAFRPGVDSFDSPLAQWVDGTRGAEFHLLYGDLNRLIPDGVGFIPDVLQHWMKARPEVLAQSAAMRILGPDLIATMVNGDVLCHELDDSIEDEDGSLRDRICQVISLDPPQLNLWDLVATRDMGWIPSEGKFTRVTFWRLVHGAEVTANTELYYWIGTGFERVHAKFTPVRTLHHAGPSGKVIIEEVQTIDDGVDDIYTVKRVTRDHFPA